jgi:UDP-glucose 4-epimerase
MRILVTGGAGFIGSHVVDAYVARGHHVTVVDDLSTGRKTNVNPKARFIKADIRDSSLSRLFKKGRFDLVNHHAAQLDVRKSVSEPTFDASVNILGLLNLLELSRLNKVKKFIFLPRRAGPIMVNVTVLRGKRPRPSPSLPTVSPNWQANITSGPTERSMG